MLATGIDVSHHNGDVDWSKVAGAGVDFAFVKATEGTGYWDPTFYKNWAGAKAAGLVRGAYHFCRPGSNPRDQAQYFAFKVGPLASDDLPPVADFEVTDHLGTAECRAWLGAFLAECERQFGRQPILYASPGFFAGAVGDTTPFTGYPLWVAHYTTQPAPHLPRGFSSWLFWQYADNGRVPGIPAGAVDLDVFQGDRAALMAYVGRTQPTTPVSSPTEPDPPHVGARLVYHSEADHMQLHDVDVLIDSNGHGHQPTDFPFDRVAGVSGYEDLDADQAGRYGSFEKAVMHQKDGKLDIYVEGGAPGFTVPVRVAVVD